MKTTDKLRLLLIGSALGVSIANADSFVVDQSDAMRPHESSSIIVPYAFSTEFLETGAGALLYRQGLFQERDGAWMTGYGTTNSSYGLYAGLVNLQLADRWFVNGTVGYSFNEQQAFWGDLGYVTGEVPAGSNDSVLEDAVIGPGSDSYAIIDFRYVLPIGSGGHPQPAKFVTNNGLLVAGTTRTGPWNPFRSGRTVFTISPHYEHRDIEITPENIGFFPPDLGLQIGEMPSAAYFWVTLALDYDNTDFSVNPSRGSKTKFSVSKDWGAFNSTYNWTSLDFSLSNFWSLGESKWFAQRVLATDIWVAYTPTWEVVEVAPGNFLYAGRSSGLVGASLGGRFHQRGYPRGRFSDKSAINYAAELRFIPRADPFRKWPIIRNWPWRWWQAVAFAEIGRVAPSWDLDSLHEDMKWSAGVGIRAMIGGSIARVDLATSEEVTAIWVVAGHAF